MRRRLLIWLLVVLTVPLVGGCQQKTEQSAESPSGEESQTKLFLNIDVPKIGVGKHKHFDQVDGYGSQAKSEPGIAGGFMAMKDRKFQRFQIRGSISKAGRAKLYSELKSDLATVVEANGAKFIGNINETVHDRPIWYLYMVLPSVSKVDLENLEGFYFEYADESGNGFVDVMATKTESNGETEIWHVGFAIHEPHTTDSKTDRN